MIFTLSATTAPGSFLHGAATPFCLLGSFAALPGTRGRGRFATTLEAGSVRLAFSIAGAAFSAAPARGGGGDLAALPVTSSRSSPFVWSLSFAIKSSILFFSCCSRAGRGAVLRRRSSAEDPRKDPTEQCPRRGGGARASLRLCGFSNPPESSTPRGGDRSRLARSSVDESLLASFAPHVGQIRGPFWVASPFLVGGASGSRVDGRRGSGLHAPRVNTLGERDEQERESHDSLSSLGSPSLGRRKPDR